jgi:hypothetical protein
VAESCRRTIDLSGELGDQPTALNESWVNEVPVALPYAHRKPATVPAVVQSVGRVEEVIHPALEAHAADSLLIV